MDPSNKQNFLSEQGQLLLKPIFYEFDTSEMKDRALYTLKDHDLHVGNRVFPSLSRIFVSDDSLEEYHFADTYLYSWKHLQRLKECGWFSQLYDDWVAEKASRLKSQNLENVRKIASDPRDKNFFSAQKFLIERAEPKEKVGRPLEKAKLEKAVENLEDQEILKDLERISVDD